MSIYPNESSYIATHEVRSVSLFLVPGRQSQLVVLLDSSQSGVTG